MWDFHVDFEVTLQRMCSTPLQTATYIQIACMLGCMLQSLPYTGSIPKWSFPLAVGIKGVILP